MRETLNIDEFEGHTVLVYECENGHRECMVLTGPSAGDFASEDMKPEYSNPKGISKQHANYILGRTAKYKGELCSLEAYNEIDDSFVVTFLLDGFHTIIARKHLVIS